jgi:hypothetical protein
MPVREERGKNREFTYYNLLEGARQRRIRCLGKLCYCMGNFYMCRDLDYCDGIGMIGKAISETIDRESWISLHRSICNPAELVTVEAFATPLLDVRCILNVEK